MASLIITIIGIALVAVAAIMGAYYGGVAFENSQAQAAANQMLSDAQQIESAFRLYSLDHNGSLGPPAGSDDGGFQWLVTGGYLSSLPEVPANVSAGNETTNYGTPAPSNNKNPYYCVDTWQDFSGDPPLASLGLFGNNTSCKTDANLGSNDSTAPPVFVIVPMLGTFDNNGYQTPTSFQQAVCQDIANAARSGSYANIYSHEVDTIISTGLKFDCGLDGGYSIGGELNFVYQIY